MAATEPGTAAPRPSAEPRLPAAPAAREPKKRPDPRPMRLAFGVTGLAALSAMIAGIVSPAQPASAPLPADPSAAASTTAADAPTTISVPVQHVTKYVTLKPGQTAPPGATVVTKPDPSPRIVVTQITIPAPAQARPAPQRVVVQTKQSGGG